MGRAKLRRKGRRGKRHTGMGGKWAWLCQRMRGAVRSEGGGGRRAGRLKIKVPQRKGSRGKGRRRKRRRWWRETIVEGEMGEGVEETSAKSGHPCDL